MVGVGALRASTQAEPRSLYGELREHKTRELVDSTRSEAQRLSRDNDQCKENQAVSEASESAAKYNFRPSLKGHGRLLVR